MKRTFAVVLLFLSFASAALADGSGGMPPHPGTVIASAKMGIAA
jgi:hypothetical protein